MLLPLAILSLLLILAIHATVASNLGGQFREIQSPGLLLALVVKRVGDATLSTAQFLRNKDSSSLASRSFSVAKTMAQYCGGIHVRRGAQFIAISHHLRHLLRGADIEYRRLEPMVYFSRFHSARLFGRGSLGLWRARLVLRPACSSPARRRLPRSRGNYRSSNSSSRGDAAFVLPRSAIPYRETVPLRWIRASCVCRCRPPARRIVSIVARPRGGRGISGLLDRRGLLCLFLTLLRCYIYLIMMDAGRSW